MDGRPLDPGNHARAPGRDWPYLLVGCALAGGALVGGLSSVARWWGAERVEGTVVALASRATEDGVAYYPVVEYVIKSQPYRCEGGFGFGPDHFRVGERVGVLYRPGRPQDAVIDNFSQRLGGYGIFAAAGLLFLLVPRLMRPAENPPSSPQTQAVVPPAGPDEPDFRDEMGVRGYVLGNLGCLVVFVVFFIAVAGLLPVALGGFGRWWAWFVAAFCGLGVAWTAAAHGPLLARGGVYRVVVRGGRLRVDSPHPILGRSFDVPLAEVRRLVVRRVDEGEDRYEVHAGEEDVYEVRGPCARQLFEALAQVHPAAAVERR
jgi:Protein of unknown function (DUF3592)